MGTAKVYGVNMLFFFLLNLILFLIYMAVGGVDYSSLGYIGTITNDLGGFIGAVITPGGTEANVFSSSIAYLRSIYDINRTAIAPHIVGLLWIWIPGTVSAFLSGRFFSKESTQASFWGTTLSIMTLNLLLLLILFVPIFDIVGSTPIATGAIANTFVTSPILYSTNIEYLVMIIFSSLFNGLVFGGISAASSNVL